MRNHTNSRVTGDVQRAALYMRVSSEEQAKHGYSLEAQREKLEQYARDNGLRVVSEYRDEGISARKSYKRRPEFLRMINDVEHDRLDLILFIKLDRWFRSVADYYEVQRVLDAHDVRWIATEEEYDTTTANGRLHLNIKLSIAQDEADRTSERIKFVFESKVHRGEVISGKVPLGYRIEGKRLVIDEEQAAIVRDIFKQYLALRSIAALRKYLLNTYGMLRSPTGLRVLLQQERYVGRAHGMDDFCPPIIDRKTFDLVQELIQKRAQRNAPKSRNIYLFTSLLFCAECGNRICAKKITDYTYYRCTHFDRGSCTHNHYTPEVALEGWLLSNLLEEAEKYNQRITEAAPPEKKDLSAVKRKMERLKELYLNDLIDLDTYRQDYEALRAELVVPAPKPAPDPVSLPSLASALALYNDLTRENKKAFWARIIKRITITNDDDFHVEFI